MDADQFLEQYPLGLKGKDISALKRKLNQIIDDHNTTMNKRKKEQKRASFSAYLKDFDYSVHNYENIQYEFNKPYEYPYSDYIKSDESIDDINTKFPGEYRIDINLYDPKSTIHIKIEISIRYYLDICDDKYSSNGIDIDDDQVTVNINSKNTISIENMKVFTALMSFILSQLSTYDDSFENALIRSIVVKKCLKAALSLHFKTIIDNHTTLIFSSQFVDGISDCSAPFDQIVYKHKYMYIDPDIPHTIYLKEHFEDYNGLKAFQQSEIAAILLNIV